MPVWFKVCFAQACRDLKCADAFLSRGRAEMFAEMMSLAERDIIAYPRFGPGLDERDILSA